MVWTFEEDEMRLNSKTDTDVKCRGQEEKEEAKGTMTESSKKHDL